MNLETLVDKLDKSKSREFANQIFEQMDIIEDSKDELNALKEMHLVHLHESSIPLIRERETYHALNIGFSKDYKANILEAKHIAKAKNKELKSDYKTEVKQLKSEIKKFEERLDSYYKHHKKEYEKAIEANVKDASQQLEKFEKNFKEFKELQMQNITQKNLTRIDELTQNYEKQVQEINEKLQENIENELKNHAQLKQDHYVQNNKNEIKRIQIELKKIVKNSKQEKNLNKEKVFAAKKQYLTKKNQALEKIKAIKQEKKAYAKTLSPEELKEFQSFEKLIQQEMIARKKENFHVWFKKKTGNLNAAYFFVAPAFLGALVMTIFPFFFMLITAWFKLDLVNLQNSQFVGFKNFVNIFTRDTEFQKALGNTAIYAFVTFILLTIVSVLMAAWLAKNTRIHNMAQTMVFTPHIASLVAVSIVWIALLNPSGIINQILAVFGIKGPGWLIQENTSLISVSFVQVWKDIGYYVLIIISGLQGIPSDVYEAAKLDKASKSTTFFKVTLPLLMPTLSFVFVTKFINSFKVFAPIEIMTNGGPMGSSMVLSYWIYKVGRLGYNYGHAMAGAIVLTIIVGVCTALNYKFFARRTK